MSLRERLVRALKRLTGLFKPQKRWYEIDMRQFVQAENARQWREPQS